MAKSKCVPLKVTAHLVDGRFSSATGVIMLDAILYHAWFIKYAPKVLDGIYDEEFIKKEQKYIGLPLRQLPGNRWAASKGIYTQIGMSIEHYNKRPDFLAADKIDYLKDVKGIINDKAGPYRAYRQPQIIRTVKDGEITFYAVGHAAEMQELLDLMVGVGKKTAMGFGFVEKWDIERVEQDYTTEHPVHGLMRPIVVEEAEKNYQEPVMLFGVKPPYWKSDNMRMCYVPIPR